MLRAFYRVNFVTSYTHTHKSIKYFRREMLSYGSQRKENDLNHLNAVSCMVRTSVVCCLDIMMFWVQQWCYL